MPGVKGRPKLLHNRDIGEATAVTDQIADFCSSLLKQTKHSFFVDANRSRNKKKNDNPLRFALDQERDIWKAKVNHYQAQAIKLAETEARNVALQEQLFQLQRDNNRLHAKLHSAQELTFDEAFEMEYENMLQNPALPKHENARRTFEESFQAVLQFRKDFGHLDIGRDYKCSDGYNLGKWVKNLRFAYKQIQAKGTANRTLEPAHVDRLVSIGFEFTRAQRPKVSWATRIQQLQRYKQQHGTTQVPYQYKYDDHLGAWVEGMRSRRKGTQNYAPLTAAQIQELDALGFIWSVKKRKKSAPAAAAPKDDSSSGKAESAAAASPRTLTQTQLSPPEKKIKTGPVPTLVAVAAAAKALPTEDSSKTAASTAPAVGASSPVNRVVINGGIHSVRI